jgi:poly(A) polymerase
LSRERVRAELMKLLLAPHAVPTLAVMAESGLLAPVLGGVPDFAGFSNMAKVEAAIGVPADPVQRLGALAVQLPEDAERLWQRLRLSNREHERLVSMGDAWRQISPHDQQAGRALLYRLGPERFVDRVLIAWARAWPQGAHDPAWQALATLPARWQAPMFPLKAPDFVRRGVAPGPALGAALREAEEAWIAADFPSDARALDDIAASAVVAAKPM